MMGTQGSPKRDVRFPDRLFVIPILATLWVPADTNRAATVREPDANRRRKANPGRIF